MLRCVIYNTSVKRERKVCVVGGWGTTRDIVLPDKVSETFITNAPELVCVCVRCYIAKHRYLLLS